MAHKNKVSGSIHSHLFKQKEGTAKPQVEAKVSIAQRKRRLIEDYEAGEITCKQMQRKLKKLRILENDEATS